MRSTTYTVFVRTHNLKKFGQSLGGLNSLTPSGYASGPFCSLIITENARGVADSDEKFSYSPTACAVVFQ